MKISDRITKQKLEKYLKITETALKIIKKNINQKNKKQAKKIIEMSENYLSDSKYFKSKKDFVNAFAAINYAHGWIDTGTCLGIFNVKDNKLFVLA
ncbi:MAG: DUF357 domain-containing protein [Nanoarchaeota archaeon]|nr:DUF357 domain-containing protein [Nanoarchaeota archaeon]